MATKKQKREAGIAKRKAEEAQIKADGLEAQRRDKEARAVQSEEIKKIADKINARYRRILASHDVSAGNVVDDFADKIKTTGK